MVGARLGTAFVRNRVRWAVLPARTADVAELRDAGVDGMIDRERERRCDAAHPEQRSEPGMNDRAMTPELAEARLQANRNVEQIAVAERMLDGAGPAQ